MSTIDMVSDRIDEIQKGMKMLKPQDIVRMHMYSDLAFLQGLRRKEAWESIGMVEDRLRQHWQHIGWKGQDTPVRAHVSGEMDFLEALKATLEDEEQGQGDLFQWS